MFGINQTISKIQCPVVVRAIFIPTTLYVLPPNIYT